MDEKGPIEKLCKEIGFRFEQTLERDELLVAFVAQLVSHIGEMHDMDATLVQVGGKPPTIASKEALTKMHELLALPIDKMIDASSVFHNFTDVLAPEDQYPCDHLIDMLSSCASAIRFGLEKPCRSRHAADAAQHVWKRVYGVIRFDRFTSNWEKEWARAQLTSAIAAIAFPIQEATPNE